MNTEDHAHGKSLAYKSKTPSGDDLVENQDIDAHKWAKAFNCTLVELGYQPHDEGWLIGWFANPIMIGFDVATARTMNELSELKSELAKKDAIIKELQEAVAYYASQKNWLYPGKDFHNFDIAKKDISRVNWIEQGEYPAHTTCGGKRARAALARVAELRESK